MDARVYLAASDFLSDSSGLLQSDEVRYGLIYGIARRAALNPHHYGHEDPWFCIVMGDVGISALAWRTPPYEVGLAWHTGEAEEAVSLLIESVRSRWQVIPGVTGHSEVTDLFADKWAGTCGTSIQSTKSQRIYRLDSINPISEVSGRLRLATPEDTNLISGWTRAFNIDTNQEIVRENTETITATRIENGGIYLWEDAGHPVSMARKTRPTEHGMAVNLVYTPPEFRRRGYATACVAGVCREILKSGYDFCTLYTDLSNPISNSIYMKIGFKPVCDSVQHTFSATN